ncbi:MAG: argininosuccinate synthase [Leptospirales bacterium]
MKNKVNKIVLAYSGGLDTSVILHWLKKEYQAEVVAYCADIGQEEELDGLEEKAAATGASKCYVSDLVDEFASDFIFPAIRGSAVYEMRYLLGTSIARPLIAKRHVEIALEEGADAVSHGATGKGNDQVRFELTFMALAPQLKIISPWRTWEFEGREDLIEYARKENIPVLATAAKPYSMDRNLLHISYEGGILEDPFREPDEEMFIWTKSLKNAASEPEYVEIGFEKGDAVSINGEKMKPSDIMRNLNKTASAHGIGRVDIVENRLVGIKSRGIYETPAGTLLHIAHRDLESITLERDTQHLKDEISIKYAALVYNGKWYHPEREALQVLIDHTQEHVNGIVRMQLYKGNARVVGRKSPDTLYSSELASFEGNIDYDQADAEGFIKIYGLTAKNSYRRHATGK